MSDEKKIYGLADKAWQVVVGCDPSMKCAPRCWARRTTARIAQQMKTANPKRSAFFGLALSADLNQWSGEVRIDREHLNDPLHWSKPALVATGFHGDIGRLPTIAIEMILDIAARCPQHNFMLLTKVPGGILAAVRQRHVRRLTALSNVTIGCSIMDQRDADKHRRVMAQLDGCGWATHVWHEPAVEGVDWSGWEFLKLIVCGGESGPGARPFHVWWAKNDLAWCQAHAVAFFMKQVGAVPVGFAEDYQITGKGDDVGEWPARLCVQDSPFRVRF